MSIDSATLCFLPRRAAMPWRRAMPALLLSALAGSASAAMVSGSYSFQASGFGAGAPHEPVTGVVSFSFDNSATFFGAANGAIANGQPVQVSFSGLSLPGSWTPVLTYVLSGSVGGNPVQDLLAIGHALNGTATTMGTDDWRIAFNAISTAPSFREFTYTLASAPGQQFQTFAGQVSAVPQPPASLLLLAGLAGLLALRRRAAQ